ncbi:hypothetical protein PC129_g4948 [Phytophthora cactorum]|uniref:Uncharacterized protein n=1 Tax=Phytophthora cactorum TaxID=29920 RepID=A0A8T1E3B2_9STRA|nr:hypothetical protein Pcac1_g19417 [Phytophthora cactorum]KAG2935820.1 hypothetical protein PC114_g394 [Phytophthora cactorum]KAG2947407.1 hypothetical protein PC117_g6838 [Phytophthora cactorum]KAG3035861.1 hypothetical protein PC120_g578 [Phytophthora cactorum]KAG3041807.1 hypothetical protein PC119_g508 [Phytophthora cactorum]
MGLYAPAQVVDSRVFALEQHGPRFSPDSSKTPSALLLGGDTCIIRGRIVGAESIAGPCSRAWERLVLKA